MEKLSSRRAEFCDELDRWLHRSEALAEINESFDRPGNKSKTVFLSLLYPLSYIGRSLWKDSNLPPRVTMKLFSSPPASQFRLVVKVFVVFVVAMADGDFGG